MMGSGWSGPRHHQSSTSVVKRERTYHQWYVFRRLDSDNLHSDTQIVIDDAVVAVVAAVAAVGVHSLAERLSDFSAPCAS